MKTDTTLDYLKRINRAIDYIVANLDEPCALDVIAKVANFSPYHFHRVFRAAVGETLQQFVKRLRLERALWMLSHQQPQSLTEVAMSCGFASSSDFSRAFKQRYDVPPSEFDLESLRGTRRQDIDKIASGKDACHRIERLPVGDNPDKFEVRLRQFPARCVAYLRVFDPYRPDVVEEATGRFLAWADARHLSGGQWLGYQWDDPGIVELKDCRYDIGLEVSDVEPDGEIGRIEFPAMQVAEIEVRGSIELEMRAMDWLFGTWLPNSGFQPGDHPFFEAWIGRPFQHGNEYFEVLVQIPVKRC